VSRLLQCRAHLILCLRADEKLRIEQIKEGNRTKTVIVQPKDMPPNERWVPICEKRFMFEMTLSLILTPANPGVPVPIKLQAQHRDAVPLDKQLSEETGRKLAAWAAGGATPSISPARAPEPAEPAASSTRQHQKPSGSTTDDAAGPSESERTYIKKWDDLLETTEGEAAIRQLGTAWNSEAEKEMRRVVFGGQTPELGALVGRVKVKMNSLKKTGAPA
jgi:hypothetical protein